MFPLHTHQPQAASGEPLSEADLQQVSGGLLNVQKLLIRELVCRQGIPLDVLKNGRFDQILTNPLRR